MPESFFGSQTGFPNGYCTSMCGAVGQCPSDAACVDLSQGQGSFYCVARCSPARAGDPNSCRAGYVCDLAPGGNVSQGICVPDCRADFSITCEPSSCDVATGLCADPWLQ